MLWSSVAASLAAPLPGGWPRRGAKVTVLDRSEPGAEASAAAGGMLAPLGEMVEPRTFADLCVASRNLYRRFAAEIEEASGHHTGYRSEGSLLVALEEKDERELGEIHRTQTALGFTLERLTAERCGKVSRTFPSHSWRPLHSR